MILILDQIIKAIAGITNPLIKNKLQRNEIVIQLLKRFNLNPEHPPADFSGVYAFTLVEYGVGKPKPLLELFHQEPIKQAFRKALDHNNLSIILSEVDAFVDGYVLGDEIKSLKLDVRREIAEFATVFIEVAKRTRTPADVLMNQDIGSLHQRIASIQKQLQRLPTLEGIRTEIARLAVENSLTLSGTTTENKCRAIALAQQMRGWFETLGYRLEKYEIWAEEYFEWIINIPVRRRYDRILVRGVAGEVGLSDVMVLRESVAEQKTDEGWLVTTRRISKAARDEVKKEENRHLDCYTFDELIDLDADFSSYLNWLETEIKARKIDQNYVPLACTKEEIDPVNEQRIGVSRYGKEDGWIDGYIDKWLGDQAKEHISILGEFGTGKTWFAFHYACTALQRYQDAQKRGVERPRLPLVISLRDYAKAVSVESLFSEFFFRQYEIPLPHYNAFVQLNRMGKLLLIFDGFDEMAAKVDRQQMINNFWELAKVVVPGSKVILTCRTEHFPKAKQGRALLNPELQASTAKLTGETPQFEVLELEKFNDEQIRLCLSYHADTTTVEQVMGNPQLLDLARRPVMTELILEALPYIKTGKPVDMSQVYLYAVRRKMERDIKAERTFTSLADKLYFLCELSWEILSTDQMSLNYRLFPDRIRRLFGSAVQEEKNLDHWHYDMMGQTMLIRNADGDYTPAHRSLLEFFVAYKFAAELGALAPDFTELAQAQSHLNNSAADQDYTWSGYFSRQLDETGHYVAQAPLKAFTSEPLEKLRATLGKAPLTKAVIDLLVPMLGNYHSIINIIETTRGKNEDEVGYTGGNAATILVKKNPNILADKDLTKTFLKGADFSKARLFNADLSGANLEDAEFTDFLGNSLSVTLNQNGDLLAVGDSVGVIHLWKVDSQGTKKRFIKQQVNKGHTSNVWSVKFSPDNKCLVSGSDDHMIKIWDVESGQLIKTIEGHQSWISSIDIARDRQLLASGGGDRKIKLWNLETGSSEKDCLGHTQGIHTVQFHPNSKILASGSSDQTVRLWDVDTGNCLAVLEGHTDSVFAVSFNLDGSMIASAGADKQIQIWNIQDIEKSKLITSWKAHSDDISSIAFSPVTKTTLASSSHDTTVKLWDIKNIGEIQLIATLNEPINWVHSVAFSQDGKTLFCGCEEQTVYLWNIQRINEIKPSFIGSLSGYNLWAHSIAINRKGSILACGYSDQVVRIWNADTYELQATLSGHQGNIFSVAFSPTDDQTLASASYDSTVKLWNTQTEVSRNLIGHTNWVFAIAFSPDGKYLASGSADKLVKLWDVSKGECIHTFSDHQKRVYSISFSKSGQFLASASDDATVKIWNVQDRKLDCSLEDNEEEIHSIAFSPTEESILASGGADGRVRLWNIHTKQLQILEGHELWINSVAFSPNGKILASASERKVILWDVSKGEKIKQLVPPESNYRLSVVAFAPTGNILVSSGADGAIIFWDANTGELVKDIPAGVPYKDMNIHDILGLTERQIATLKSLGAVERRTSS
ncbi:WD40 domain-containing protein [Amazonocrinis nigriterrae]|nr:NACHT domain-containing protein [Amazonocrinis nigriterrae]